MKLIAFDENPRNHAQEGTMQESRRKAAQNARFVLFDTAQEQDLNDQQANVLILMDCRSAWL